MLYTRNLIFASHGVVSVFKRVLAGLYEEKYITTFFSIEVKTSYNMPVQKTKHINQILIIIPPVTQLNKENAGSEMTAAS